MKDDFGYSLEDRELFLEFLKTGTVWGIYYGMSEAEIIEKFGKPDSNDDPDETSYYYYRWFGIGLRYLSLDNRQARRAISIELDPGSLGLFGLKQRNEDDASRLIKWLERRDLLSSYDDSVIRLKSGITIEYQIIKTKLFAKALAMYIESDLKSLSVNDEGTP